MVQLRNPQIYTVCVYSGYSLTNVCGCVHYCMLCRVWGTVRQANCFIDVSGLQKSPVQSSGTSRFFCGTNTFSGLLAQWERPRKAIYRLKIKKVTFSKHVTLPGASKI